MGDDQAVDLLKDAGMGQRSTPASEAPLRLEYMDPRELVAHKNPLNWRGHPDVQAQALRSIKSRVGWAGAILYNETTGNVLDGHLRIDDAVESGESQVPVLVGKWNEVQEKYILATHDPLGALAEVDSAALGALLPQIESDNAAVKTMLMELETNIETTDKAFEFNRRGAVERAAYITLLVAVTQHRIIEAAIEHCGRTLNISRGDALQRVCQEYVDAHKKDMGGFLIQPEEIGVDKPPELTPEQQAAAVADAVSNITSLPTRTVVDPTIPEDEIRLVGANGSGGRITNIGVPTDA